MSALGAHGSAALFFALFLVLTIALTTIAARRTRSSSDFFAAGHRIGAGQNGLALAGDFVAASAFLGVTGIAALSGFDAIVFALATLSAWPLMLFLLAEPLRALGKYTFADVIEYRLGRADVKTWTSLATIVSIFSILTFQMAGAGAVIKLLFGLPYPWAVVAIGGFMLVYVLFGGMIATTWVQIVKIVLLVGVSLFLAGCVLASHDWSLDAVLAAAAARAGPNVLGPTGSMGALQLFSIGVATTLGVASLPQILLRFYTVPDAIVARRSMLIATLIIGFCLLLFVFIGFGTMAVLGPDVVRAADRGGNMAIPLIADHYGGPALLGFVGAVAFAAILAAVCGILLAGSAALAHDLWIGVVRRDAARPGEELRVARVATVLLTIGGVGLAVLVEGQNIFVLSALSGAIAASTIFPVMIMAIYWRGLTYAGAVAGMMAGLASALVLLYFSPLVQVAMLGRPSAVIALASPAIVSAPFAFLVTIVVSMMTPDALARERYAEIEARAAAGWR